MSKSSHLPTHRRRSACAWLVAVVALAVPGVAQADVLNDWNVIAQGQATTLRPPDESRKETP